MSTDYQATAYAWAGKGNTEAVDAVARHLHANESLHMHEDVESAEPCSYCWLRAAKSVQALRTLGYPSHEDLLKLQRGAEQLGKVIDTNAAMIKAMLAEACTDPIGALREFVCQMADADLFDEGEAEQIHEALDRHAKERAA